MSLNVIETDALTKYYGRSRGIMDIGFCVNEGEIFGFIGPNGAGKSTTIRLFLNFIFPTSGRASIFGMDCIDKSAAIKQKVGYVPSEVNLYKEMTVRAILAYAASFRRNADSSYVKELCDRFELETGKRIGELSSGNKKKVAIVQALLDRPKLLILDEPTTGLDPLMQNKLLEFLTVVNKEGTTIFLSSHNLAEVQRICSRVAIIREGRIIEVKKLTEITGKSRIIRISSGDGDLEAAVRALDVGEIHKANSYMVFKYDRPIDALIKAIAPFRIDDMFIEESSLESSFLDYYKKGDEQV